MALVATMLALTAAHHPGCQTVACDRRVTIRAHARTRHRWRQRSEPHRPWLARVRACESGGRYRIDTGNGFFGAYQFTITSWRAVGGRGYPHRAEPLEQDFRAVRLLHVQGRGAWPVCG